MVPAAMDRADTATIKRNLDVLRIVALADLILLVVLLYVAFVADDDGAVSVIGPIHGIGYIVMLLLTARGAGEGWWGWWFPVAVVVTLGPPGSIYGDLRVRRELAQQGA